MSGNHVDLTPKQQSSLNQFKENIKDVMKDSFNDAYLLRWLRARAWDLKKSEKMLRDSLEWRKNFGADTILQDYTIPEVIEKYYPGGYYGYDKMGCPLWIDTLGTLDLKGMYFSVKKSEVVRYKIYTLELLYQKIFPEQSKKMGKTIDNSSLIFDMAGMGMKNLWKPAVDSFNEIARLLEANYPETTESIYIINAPSIFPITYNVVKPFISEDTRDKIKVLGKDWKKELLKYIDADQLPVAWGGTATDPDGDPHCKSKVNMGGTVPEKYRKEKPDVDLSKFTTITVAKGSSEQIPIDVLKPRQILTWQFWTDDNDIGFGIFRRTSKERQKASEMEEVKKSERVNSHMIPEDGSLTCEKLGTYVLRFDNTYSWVNAKKMSYLLELLEPSDLQELHVNPEDLVTTM